jgi:hypothetical protein
MIPTFEEVEAAHRFLARRQGLSGSLSEAGVHLAGLLPLGRDDPRLPLVVLLADLDRPMFDVDIGPRQRSELGRTHVSEQRDGVEPSTSDRDVAVRQELGELVGEEQLLRLGAGRIGIGWRDTILEIRLATGYSTETIRRLYAEYRTPVDRDSEREAEAREAKALLEHESRLRDISRRSRRDWRDDEA